MTTTRHLTILLTDIKGFSDKTSHKSRKDIDAMLAEHRDIVLPALEDRGGRLLKTIGDAFLMTFDSPTDAVLAGVAVQDALRKRNEGRVGEDKLEVRIAIHSGEVNITDSDIFGEPVNITARIEGIAEAGEVFFTEAVYFAMNKAEVPSSEVGRFKLKGIDGEFKVYKVRRETPLSGTNGPALAAVNAAKVIFVDEPAPKAWRTDAPRPEPARAGPPAAAGPEDPHVRTARRRGMWRRAAATAVDVVLVSTIAGMLAADDSETYNVKVKPKPRTKAAAAAATKSTETFKVGAGGIHIEDGDETVKIDVAGIHVKDRDVEVKLDMNGLSFRDKNDGGGDEHDGDEDGLIADGENMSVTRHVKRRSPKDKIFPFLWIGMNMLALSMWGATPGKRMLSYRVVRHDDGSVPDWKMYLMRTLLTFVSATPLGLGYLWAWWDKDGRGWHDLLAGTRVVRDEAKSA